MLPFYPKLAAESDAPGYQELALGDERCESCSSFRALATGGGYCEQFAFHAAPEGACDDFLRVGRTRTKLSFFPIPRGAEEDLEARKDSARRVVKDISSAHVSVDTLSNAARVARTTRTANYLKLLNAARAPHSNKS